MQDRFLRAIQHRNARVAVGGSALRGPGSAGAAESARIFLGALDLRPFGTTSSRRFFAHLDRTTDHLRSALPTKSRHWGLARKGLNIFLRNCLYTTYLCERYQLDRAEQFFEVPLDRICGGRLYRASGGALPRWPGVRGLDPLTSALYQAVAATAASKARIARVHLDAVWWGARDGDET
jgi:hypothetical protein